VDFIEILIYPNSLQQHAYCGIILEFVKHNPLLKEYLLLSDYANVPFMTQIPNVPEPTYPDDLVGRMWGYQVTGVDILEKDLPESIDFNGEVYAQEPIGNVRIVTCSHRGGIPYGQVELIKLDDNETLWMKVCAKLRR
jgi:hypothetical protein